MAGELSVSIDAPALRELVGRSSQLEPKLKTALRKRLRAAADPAVADVKAAVMAPGQTRARRPTSTGLRRELRSRIRVQLSATQRTTGVRITSGGRLAGAWESRRGWRHPVLGNRDAWVTQVGNPYFYRRVAHHRPDVARGVNLALEDAAQTLNLKG